MFIQNCYSFNTVTEQGVTHTVGSTFDVNASSVDLSSSGGSLNLQTFNNEDISLQSSGEVVVTSDSVTAGAENLLLGLDANSALKSLGVSLLGSGTVSFTLPFDYHVHFIPLFFFSSITYNDALNDIQIGASTNEQNALYATVTENYTGIMPLSGGVLNYPNLKVLAVVNSDSNLLEVESSPQLVTTPVQFSPYYYLELRYVKAGAHSATNGISNSSVNTNINVKVHYVVFA